jgi:hypothetical protein
MFANRPARRAQIQHADRVRHGARLPNSGVQPGATPGPADTRTRPSGRGIAKQHAAGAHYEA